MKTGQWGRRLAGLATALLLCILAPTASIAAGGKALGVNPDASATTDEVTLSLIHI